MVHRPPLLFGQYMRKSFRSRTSLAELRTWSIACVALLIMPSCSSLSGYSGDGHFVDHGWLSPERYVLDLGPIDLSRPGRYSYRFSGLPSERMTIGLEIVEAEGTDSPPRPSHPARVRVLLRTADNQIVVAEEAALDTWAWSRTRRDPRSFYYRKGEMRYVSLGQGVSRPERVGEKFDGGWGSSFIPNPGRAYVLSLEVVNSEQNPVGSARLMLEGGGMTYP